MMENRNRKGILIIAGYHAWNGEIYKKDETD